MKEKTNATVQKIVNNFMAARSRSKSFGFCYWDKKDIDLTKDVEYAPQDKRKCVETEFTIKEKTAEAQIDFYSCNQDSDCIEVKAGCCGCTAGGTAVSVNKAYQDEWLKNFDCTEIMCPAVMSGDPSCINKKPKCENNKCILK